MSSLRFYVISYFRRGALGPEAGRSGISSDGRRRSRINSLYCTIEYRLQNSTGSKEAKTIAITVGSA